MAEKKYKLQYIGGDKLDPKHKVGDVITLTHEQLQKAQTGDVFSAYKLVTDAGLKKQKEDAEAKAKAAAGEPVEEESKK